MDPVTVTVVSALAAGAAAAVKDVATSAIKDGYAGLKRLITDRYERAAPFADAVEADPASEPEQMVLANQLDQAGAAQDEELKAAAQAVSFYVGESRAKRAEVRNMVRDLYKARSSFVHNGETETGSLCINEAVVLVQNVLRKELVAGA